MKKWMLSTAFLLLALPCLAQSFGPGNDSTRLILTLRSPSIKALDDYPQRILDIAKADTLYRIDLLIINPYLDQERSDRYKTAAYDPGHGYSPETARYLQSTPLIDARNGTIVQLADSLFGNEKQTRQVIQKGLRFVSAYLTYDEELAQQIDAGTCRTLDVGTVIQRKKGTCSEYTNLFIALMRHKNIPTRFVTGFIYMPEQNYMGTHAWAECYVENVGWCAVDPQNGSPGFPHPKAIKMRHGLDYDDCDIRTLDQDIEPIRIEKIL